MPPRRLTSTSIDCQGHDTVILHFWRWLGIEGAEYDHAAIEASTNGSSWTTVWEHTDDTLIDSAWTECTYDISAIAANQATVYLRWTMGPSDIGLSFQGWNIDDIALIDPNGDYDGDGISDTEEGDGDFDNDNLPNWQDPDSDDDEIPDSVEHSGDSERDDIDQDGAPNWLDLDSDGDDVSDADESCGGLEDTEACDIDLDGLPNYLDVDSDGDGIPDGEEMRAGSDPHDASSIPALPLCWPVTALLLACASLYTIREMRLCMRMERR